MKQISEFFEWIAVGVLPTFLIGVRVALVNRQHSGSYRFFATGHERKPRSRATAMRNHQICLPALLSVLELAGSMAPRGAAAEGARSAHLLRVCCPRDPFEWDEMKPFPTEQTHLF
jgi:hypothetical protein